MAYAFRQSSTNGNSSGAALTVSKPTGTADGDLIVVNAYLENASNTWSSVGAGFTALRRDTHAAGFSVQVFWKIASGEPASWTWTPTTGASWRTVVVASYSGATSTGGDQVDVEGALTSINNPTTSISVTGVTTTAANDIGLAILGNIQGVPAGFTSGFASNERADFGGCQIYDAQKATAGATGNTLITVTGDVLGRTVAFLLDAPGAGGGGYTPPPVFPGVLNLDARRMI